MAKKIGKLLLIALLIAWELVAAPEIIRGAENPIAATLVVFLGSLWIIAVPTAYFLVMGWLETTSDAVPKSDNVVALWALLGGFAVSYVTLAFFVGLGAITVFNLGGMYESGGLWGIAPLLAGKFSCFGLLVGALVGFVVSRYANV